MAPGSQRRASRRRVGYTIPMKHERITVDPTVMVGKPCIKGTRITVDHILRELGAGTLISELLAAHPRLTREDILAAVTYAADVLALEEISFGKP